MDAVVLANYATEHATFAIRCLRAGRHVMSEVLPSETMAQAVELIETVEETGLVYTYAENYCYMDLTFEMWEKIPRGRNRRRHLRGVRVCARLRVLLARHHVWRPEPLEKSPLPDLLLYTFAWSDHDYSRSPSGAGRRLRTSADRGILSPRSRGRARGVRHRDGDARQRRDCQEHSRSAEARTGSHRLQGLRDEGISWHIREQCPPVQGGSSDLSGREHVLRAGAVRLPRPREEQRHGVARREATSTRRTSSSRRYSADRTENGRSTYIRRSTWESAEYSRSGRSSPGTNR